MNQLDLFQSVDNLENAAPAEFEISSEYAIPPRPVPRQALNICYPFDKMQVGDSFFVPLTGDAKDDARTRSRMQNAAARFVKQQVAAGVFGAENIKFTIRKFVNLDGTVGLRCWRVS